MGILLNFENPFSDGEGHTSDGHRAISRRTCIGCFLSLPEAVFEEDSDVCESCEGN